MEKVKNLKIGKVYTLSCKNGNVFYVGCTIMDLSLRLRQHISEIQSIKNNPNTTFYNRNKADKIVSLDFDIYATIVETINIKQGMTGRVDLRKCEAKWITKCIASGCELVNGGFNKKQAIEQTQVVGLKISAKDLKIKTKAKKTLKQIRATNKILAELFSKPNRFSTS